ncbi:MAG: anhydro-N-acetylmuramic acid kinase [Pseudomonadota bacterium]
MSDALTAIGLMSGASLDGIDAAVLVTDGDRMVEQGPVYHAPFDRDLKIDLRRAIKAALEGRDGAVEIGKAAGELTEAHVKAVDGLMKQAGLSIHSVDVIGFHGQTILHRPPTDSLVVGRSWQIGDGARLAEATGIDVISDFRAADIAAGGAGAPFAPVYHRALVNALPSPRPQAVGVVTLGRAANLTFVRADAPASELVAFECGPGNGLINEWIEFKTGEPMDRDGLLAAKGEVNEEAFRTLLLSPFLRRRPPKFLDRYDFKIDPIKGLTLEDGAATLTYFAAACLRQSETFLPAIPDEWVICGSGRRNPAMMAALRESLTSPVHAADEIGWRGDDLEAECFAYLAVRSLKKMPLSYPMTTRVPTPICGGVFHRAPPRIAPESKARR